jgi:hypothetical protein
MVEDLSSKKRYSEAARVLFDYAKDIREGVIALVQGNYFSEARRIVRILILMFLVVPEATRFSQLLRPNQNFWMTLFIQRHSKVVRRLWKM